MPRASGRSQHEGVNGGRPRLNRRRRSPYAKAEIKRLGARGGAGPSLSKRRRQGLGQSPDRRAALVERALARMTHMTSLDGSFWVSLSAPRGANGAAKAEAGYPPYNVDLLEGEPEALRITLAVAGFAPDQLEVSTERTANFPFAASRARSSLATFSIAASPRGNSSEAFAWQAGLRSARRSFKTAFSSSSSPARAKRNG